MIPAPQRSYILELLNALGPAADEFVVAGAQAMKFMLERARATKDIDFVYIWGLMSLAMVEVATTVPVCGNLVSKNASPDLSPLDSGRVSNSIILFDGAGQTRRIHPTP